MLSIFIFVFVLRTTSQDRFGLVIAQYLLAFFVPYILQAFSDFWLTDLARRLELVRPWKDVNHHAHNYNHPRACPLSDVGIRTPERTLAFHHLSKS